MSSTGKPRRAMALAALAGLILSACSTAIPLPALISKEDVTGSIARFVSPLSETLDPEDWRRALAALSTALDPQGNGEAVAWANPQSGLGGAVTPVGQAYPQAGRLCRAFLAEIGPQDRVEERVQGTGCRDKRGEWAVVEARPLRQS